VASKPLGANARGLTLIDMMISLAVLAIITALVAPALGPNDSLKLVSAATILASDIEFAQSESIASPGDPVLVHIDADGDQYWLARVSEPGVPILRPVAAGSDRPADVYRTDYGDGRAVFLDGIEIEMLGAPGGTGDMPFDAFGRLDQLGDVDVRISNGSDSLVVRVRASTGAVSIVD